jgi:hypothetical protein
MPPWASLVAVAAIVVGGTLAVASAVAIRASGARPGIARRLAGAREFKVGQLLGPEPPPVRAVRVSGRIRCQDPLEMGGGERLVAFHRDVEVRIGGAWRTIERLRETRSFELWDHDGSITIDPALAAEPLIVIPKVWRGSPTELEEPHTSAVARLVERDGPATEARAATRTVNVTDRLLILARPVRDVAGRTRLEPPDGGYLLTNLALDDAMRLLGGRNRRLLTAAIAGVGLSVALVVAGGLGLVLSTVLAR